MCGLEYIGIINSTHINWFHEWPKEALISVALKFLEDLDMEGREEVRVCVFIYVYIRASIIICVYLFVYMYIRTFNYSLSN